MGVKVSFLEGAPDSSAAAPVLVPKDAIRRDGEQSYVFLVKDGRIERRAVRTAGERGTDIAVIAGLRQGEMVVVSAADRLHDGERVSVRT
jgi:multidrug efflux pump subunit AcrA (membrane-fusion protein)